MKKKQEKNKPINHPSLVGDVVNLYPQRKPHAAMNGDELLHKAVTGTHKKKSAQQKLQDNITGILRK